jgi:hypothetical protein
MEEDGTKNNEDGEVKERFGHEKYGYKKLIASCRQVEPTRSH